MDGRKIVVPLGVIALGVALGALAYGLVGPLRADIAAALEPVEPVAPHEIPLSITE